MSGDIPSRQRVVDEVRRAFPGSRPNVFVVPPESAMSTYAAAEACDAVIIYGTKTGVELTSLGIPVIVAGEAWIRNKGLTTDAASAADYFRDPRPAAVPGADAGGHRPAGPQVRLPLLLPPHDPDRPGRADREPAEVPARHRPSRRSAAREERWARRDLRRNSPRHTICISGRTARRWPIVRRGARALLDSTTLGGVPGMALGCSRGPGTSHQHFARHGIYATVPSLDRIPAGVGHGRLRAMSKTRVHP